MAKKNITLSLDKKTYENYKKYCKKRGIALSRSVEIFMDEKVSDDNE